MKQGKEQKQMWIYIIVLSVIIAGIWLFFFTKQLNGGFKKEDGPVHSQSLGEILKQFGSSVKQGVNAFSEIKKQAMPEAGPMAEPAGLTASSSKNNNSSSTFDTQ